MCSIDSSSSCLNRSCFLETLSVTGSRAHLFSGKVIAKIGGVSRLGAAVQFDRGF